MEDLIYRHDTIDTIESLLDKTAKGDIGTFYNKILKLAIEHIKKIPSVQSTADVVEVVRCEYCKYHGATIEKQPTSSIMCAHMHDNDYCSYGKRRG